MSHGYVSAGHPLPASLQEIASATLREVLMVSPDALRCVDQTGTIRQINALVAQLFGYPEAALCGMPLEELLPFRFRERHAWDLRHTAADPMHDARWGLASTFLGCARIAPNFPWTSACARC